MADINQSVPVRTDNPGEVQVKIVDDLVPSQALTVNPDGSINTNATVTATDLDIRNLSATQDSVAISDGTDTLAVNTDGSVNVTDNGGSLTVDAVDLDIRDLTSATDSVEVLQTTHDDLNVNANIQVGDVDVGNANPVPVSDAGGSITVDAVDLDIRNLSAAQDNVSISDGTDVLGVNADGSINVRIVDGTPGVAVTSHDTTAALAAGGTATHTYTAVADFNLTQIVASGSGSLKVVVKINTVIRFVLFTSAASRNAILDLTQDLPIALGQTVVIELTNLDNKPFDVYSTVVGANV